MIFFGRFFWILIGDGYRIYIQKGFVKNPKDHLVLEKKNHKEASKKKNLTFIQSRSFSYFVCSPKATKLHSSAVKVSSTCYRSSSLHPER